MLLKVSVACDAVNTLLTPLCVCVPPVWAAPRHAESSIHDKLGFASRGHDDDSDHGDVRLPVMRGQEQAQRLAKAATSRNRHLVSDEEEEEAYDVGMTAKPSRQSSSRSTKPQTQMPASTSRATRSKRGKSIMMEESSDEEEEAGSDFDPDVVMTQTQGRSQRSKQSQSKPWGVSTDASASLT